MVRAADPVHAGDRPEKPNRRLLQRASAAARGAHLEAPPNPWYDPVCHLHLVQVVIAKEVGMRPNCVLQMRCVSLVGLGLLALVALPGLARADEPMLAIRHVGGESSIYAVSGVERVVFEGDTLVVDSAGWSDRYAAEAITRIEFLWGFSAIEGPEDAAALLKAMHLFQNRPNPFSPETQITFELLQAGHVELGVYSVDGRLIRTLVSEERVAGAYDVTWDGYDQSEQKVAGGVYFYKLAGPGIAESRRMILLP
jgi:hypothetical protein